MKTTLNKRCNLLLSLLAVLMMTFSTSSPAQGDTQQNWTSIEGTTYRSTLGNFSVPEVRDNGSSKQIELKYRVIHGKVPDRFVFFFNGGPGISNLTGRYSDQLLHDFSVVELGYRGIDSSTSLACPHYDKILKTSPLINDTQRERVAQAFAQCTEDYRQQGLDPRGYGLDEMVDDVDDFRKKLGAKQIHLFALSYGTRIALQYMTRYPAQTGPSVLIGANPKGHFHWAKAELSPLYVAYEKHLNGQIPAHAGGLEGLMAEVLENAPAKSWGIKLDRDRIRVVTHALLFHTKTAPLVLDAYLKAFENNDYKGLAVLSFAHDLVLPRIFEWGDFAFKALGEDYNRTTDYLAESQPKQGEIGSPISELFFAAPLGEVLSALNMPPMEPIHITTETLILSGELDFSTPPQIATEELDERFDAVQQLIVPKLGHVEDFISQPGPTFELTTQWMKEATQADVRFQAPEIKVHKTFGIGSVIPLSWLFLTLVTGGIVWFI